jgi:transposase-like protein
MSERAFPLYCPYCGNEDLRPHETPEGSPHGAWECRSCLRAFTLKMTGLISPRPTDHPQGVQR